MNAGLFKRMLVGSMAWALAGVGLAGQAATSASAGGRTNGSNGFANATAHYEGEIGFANTKTRSGEVNLARGVAVGVDENGLSLSISHAIAAPGGPALATNFNLSIDRDGTVSKSNSVAIGEGPIHRSATAGGDASHGRNGPGATSIAKADSDRFGRTIVRSESSQSGPRFVRAERDVRDRGRFEREPRETIEPRRVIRGRSW